MMTRIDARGLRCPWPTLRAGRALRTAREPIEIEADDPAAQRELNALAQALDCRFFVVAPGIYRIVPSPA